MHRFNIEIAVACAACTVEHAISSPTLPITYLALTQYCETVQLQSTTE
jgi:hypothetical protein